MSKRWLVKTRDTWGISFPWQPFIWSCFHFPRRWWRDYQKLNFLCTSHLNPTTPPLWAWRGHSLSVSVKASEVPRHRGQKYWVKSPPLGTQLHTNQSPVYRIGCDSLSYRTLRQTLKSINPKRRQHGCELQYANNLCQMIIQITKRCENATADKSNAYPAS